MGKEHTVKISKDGVSSPHLSRKENETKPDDSTLLTTSEGRLLTDEEIQLLPNRFMLPSTHYDCEVAKAQLAKCDAELDRLKVDHQIEMQVLGERFDAELKRINKRIKKEIESHAEPDFYTGDLRITVKNFVGEELKDNPWWQELWKKEGL